MLLSVRTDFAKTGAQAQKQTEYGVGVKTGSGIIRYHATCVWFGTFFVSSKFFDGLRRTETPSGPEFAKDGTRYTTFPDRLIVDVEATVFRCPARRDNVMPPDYGAGLMAGASFDVRWKRGAETRPASLLSTKEEHRSPGLRWDYLLEVTAKGVPLNDALIIDMSMRQGLSHAVLSAVLK